ncbi:S8 family serine peptidase [Gammaproteobacteria bacterium]|nr:S8 family serine peptidase [Gammaproteobacteria bacterium]
MSIKSSQDIQSFTWNMMIKNLSVIAFTALFIISCGGGGGGGSAPAPEPSPTASLSSSSSSVLLDSVVTLTWSSTNASSCTASGTWTGSKATSGTEDVTIATPGNNQFTITCSGAGGSASDSAVVEGYRNTDGVSVDGYIRQADIFIDTNDSYTADADEDTTTSDNDGKFTIKYSDGNLISLGGTDLDSGNALDNLLILQKLTGHSDFKAVTPVTSVAAFMADASLVNASLGIDSSLDISVVDPVAGKGDGGINDYLYEKGNQLTILAYTLQNITNNLNTTTETTQDYFKAIAEELDIEYSATESRVNIETEAFITKVLNNIITIKALTIDDTNKANAIGALAAVLPMVQVKASNENTTAIFDFATSTLQSDAQAIANGSASAETLTSYQTDILNYVATDQNVDVNDLVPDISALSDKVSTNEDASIDINVLANDSYNTTATLSVAIEAPSNGSATIANNIVSYTPDSDFFGIDEIAYTLSQAGQSSVANISITITSVNDIPQFTNLLTNYTVDENQTAVTSIAVSDVENEPLTVSITGTDSTSFSLSSENILSFASSPDYEEQSSYAITVSVTDGIDTLSKDVTINLNNLNDNNPVIGSLVFEAPENQTAIGNINASDADLDALIYSNTGSEISISGGGLLAFAVAPDYETKSSYTTTVTVSDGLNQLTENITIDITNLNDNPTNFTTSATFSANENQSSIGTVVATDADTQSLTYSISGSELAITSVGVLSFVDTPDYETKSSYSATVTASDGVNSGSQDISVSVIDVNDNSPVFTSETTFSIPENQLEIGSVSTTDADDGNTITYSVNNSVTQKIEVSVAANASGSGNVYVISGAQKKALFLEVGKTYRFEHPTAHPFRFSTTSDGTHGGGEAYTAGVDTSTDGVTLLTVSADTPAGLYYYCSVHAGMGADVTSSSNSFPAISASNTGALTFNQRPDFETLASFSAKVTASDGVNTTDQDIQVNISDVDVEGPVFSTPATLNADENQTEIGTVLAVDPFDATVSYALSGTDASAITLDSSSGILVFNTATDYETKSSYSVIVSATGEIATTDQNLTVNINNLNDNPPVFTSESSFSAAENQTTIGAVTASDADNLSLTFSVTGSELAITSSGTLTFVEAPDYETTTSYSATVSVTDGATTITQPISVAITDVDDVAPVITSSATFSAAENQTVIGTATATDVDSSSTTFSISGTELAITSGGDISFITAPDYETTPSYSATLTATDGINSSTQSITVNITDINEMPTFTSLATFNADENQTVIGLVTADDVDSSSITFSISGSDLALTSDGTLSFLTAPDYETKSSYSATITASDGDLSATQAITVNVNNLNDNAPVFTSSASFNADENQTSINTVTATDADDSSLSFTISGSELLINNDGILTFATTPDYETKSSYTATITVSDGVASAAQNITVSINNLNDNAPVFTSSASFSAAENQIAIGTVTATDADGNSMSFSVSGSELSISTAGQLSFITAPDYETTTSYTATVTVSDGNLTASQNITINVSNLNDNAPVISDFAANTEVSNGQTSVLTVTVTDADGDTPTLSLIGNDAGALSISAEGAIAFNSSPSFASPTDADGNNVYEFTVKADDSVNTATKSGTVTVLETNDPPTFTDLEFSYSVDENTVDVVTVSASDPDGNAIAFSLTGEDAASFAINADGVLSFAVTSNYENPSDANTNNTYEINVVISDGSNEVSQSVSITVNDIAEAPEFVGLPDIFLLEENDNTVTTIEVADPEDDEFTYEMTGPDAGQFLLGSNGFMRFVATTGADFEDPTDANTDNIYELVFTATETKSGGLQRVQNLNIQVTDLKDTFKLAGTIFSGVNSLMDGDVVMLGQDRPNSGNYGYPDIPNDSLEEAQVLITPTDVAGFIGDDIFQQLGFDADGNIIRDGNGDVIYTPVDRPDDEDWFKIDTVPNLQITLSIEDYQETVTDADGNETTVTNKATLLLYNSFGSLVDFQYTASSTDEYQTIILPDTGIHYAVVKQDVNNSKYTLSLGSVLTSSQASFITSKDAYAEGRMMTYRRFNKDFSYQDSDTYPSPGMSLVGKLRSLNESNFKGLRTINFDYLQEYSLIFGNSTYLDSPAFISTSGASQIKYLKHWKVLQYYRNKYPELDLEFDFKVHKLAGFVQDEYWAYQWGLQNIGLEQVLNAIGQETQNVAVAVIDSGSPSQTSTAWTTSAFLEGGYDFAPASDSSDGDGPDPDPTDHSPASGSHGTHVATTINALNDGNNINGFGVHVVPFNVFGNSGGAYQSDVVGAMLFAAGLSNETGTFYSGSVPIRVINLSLGSSGGSCGGTYRNGIADVTEAGLTVVAASGNEAVEEPGVYGYPASCENVISVGAVDPINNRAYYSTYNDMVDIAAPGGTVGTDINGDGQGDGILAFDGNESLANYQGTSMASPHVAGALAVIYGLKPEWTPIQMEAFINGGYLTDDVGLEGKDDEYGLGVLNLSKGFTALIDGGLDFTYATITPGSFNFGYTDTEKTISVNKIGSGDISVTQLTASNSSLVDITAIEVDSSGFGTYKVTLTRGNVPDGSYQSSISADISDETRVNLTFTYSIGAERVRPYIGYTYLLLIDDEGEAEGGWYVDLGSEGISFEVDNIPSGNYYWLFSTELDDNNYVGEYGEMVETYPELSSSANYFELTDQDINNSAVILKTRRSSGNLSSSLKLNDKKKIKINLDTLNQPTLRIIKKEKNN